MGETGELDLGDVIETTDEVDTLEWFLGGSDLDSASDHALLVGMRVFELAKSLVSREVERVVVTQVLRHQHFCHFSFEEGSCNVLDINEFLTAICTSHIRFWNCM